MLKVKRRIINAVIVLIILVCMLAYANSKQSYNELPDNIHYEETDSFAIANPRVDYITNPIGVDNKTPFFSWEMVSDKEGEKQQVYRIRVFEAGNTDKLTAENTEKPADLGKPVWDSGFVLSDETNNIAYKGEVLLPHTQYLYEIISVNEESKAIKAVSGEFRTAYLQQDDTNGLTVSERENDSDAGRRKCI